MLNQTLIEIINSGEAWAFVGSGCSVSAGLPSWDGLATRVLEAAIMQKGKLPSDQELKLHEYLTKHNLPQAFSMLKAHYGNHTVDSIVSEIFSRVVPPGDVTKTITRWPFASYITTNYDPLLERALESFGGWVPVGNTADENTKISGDVRKVVWHPHGGALLGIKNTRLVLASTDYDEIYPAGSPTLAALEAVCRMKRLVFIGFGFKDPDLVSTLVRIGRLITPSRPAFGFLANCSQKDREEYWSRYKIDIIPYSAHGNDHSDLLHVLRAYGAFVLERSARFGHVVSTPDYDIETVGLLTHNRLARTGWLPENNALDCITKGFVLAQLKRSDGQTVDQLLDALPQRTDRTEQAVRHIITQLIADKVVTETTDQLSLSAKADEIARQGKADYELAKDQFRQSVNSRANEHTLDKNLVSNVTDVTVRYLEQTSRKRGLGVAQQLVATGEGENRARAVALLQGAKMELQSATNRDAAFAAVHCIWDVLSAPRPEEKRYLGLLTQAFFGRHLLGSDPAAIEIQRSNLSATVFVADSNFIIPLLAQGCLGHEYALNLYDKLISLNCRIVTSDLLLDECVEHARWAWDLLHKHGSTSSTTIDAARGAYGYKPNAFLAGYLNHPRFGPGVFFKSFFAYVFNSTGDIPDPLMVAECLRKKGIIVQKLSDWKGFTEALWTELEEVKQEIEQRRRRNSTFTHERQVKAEAEVAIAVTRVRRHELTLNEHDTRDGFFLSHSRVVDNLPNQAHRICLTPESLFEWILSVGEIKVDDADAIFDQLLWEISKEGVDVVPRQQLLRLFHSTIDASKIKLDEVLSEHREIIRNIYAEDPENAFRDIDPLSMPGAANEVSTAALRAMQARISEEQRLRAEAATTARTAVKNAEEYERLKAEKQQRQAKGKSQKRAAQSSSGLKHKKRKKKKKK